MLYLFPPPQSLREKVLEIHRRLCTLYGCPIPYFHSLDPLSELISSLLSHRTKNADSSTAFRALRAKYPTWESLRDAPVADVQSTIPTVTWPEQKAPRLQQVLRALTTLIKEPLSLDFLSTMPTTTARAFLEQLPGVGPKTSAATLSFSTLRMRALPVDSHHHRVATRLALLPPSTPPGPSHALLESLLPDTFTPQDVYDHHQILMRLGKHLCTPTHPVCPQCPLLSLCPTGQSRTTPHHPVPPPPGHSSTPTPNHNPQ